MDIVKQLREQAAEIATEGHFGWGNTMLEAARIIEELQAAQLQRAVDPPSAPRPRLSTGTITNPMPEIVSFETAGN